MAPRKVPPDDVLVELYASGLSTLEIGKRYDVSATGVQRILRRLGVSRPHSECIRLAYVSARRPRPDLSCEKNPRWKDGRQRRAYRNLVPKRVCATCGVASGLGIHHIDPDHYNNARENLQVLCNPCHMALHKKLYWEARAAGRETPRGNGPVGWNRVAGEESK